MSIQMISHYESRTHCLFGSRSVEWRVMASVIYTNMMNSGKLDIKALRPWRHFVHKASNQDIFDYLSSVKIPSQSVQAFKSYHPNAVQSKRQNGGHFELYGGQNQ